MRHFVLFVLAVGMLFTVLACEDQQKSKCNCGSEHHVGGYGPGTTTSPARSSFEGRATIDGFGVAAVDGDDPSVMRITDASCVVDGGPDASDDADAGDADARDAADASDDDAGDASIGGSSASQDVAIDLHLPKDARPGTTIDLAHTGAVARALDRDTCRVVTIALAGTVLVFLPDGEGDIAYQIDASSIAKATRAIAIHGTTFDTNQKTSSYSGSPGYTDCY